MELKSSVVYHECPIIFITLNPGDLYSPISLYYTEEKIDPKHFLSQWYTSSYRLKMMLRNPLTVVEYFHTLINTIIEQVFKKGMFGDLRHYYGTIEYQGRGTPHIHIIVWPTSYQTDIKLALAKRSVLSSGNPRKGQTRPRLPWKITDIHISSRIGNYAEGNDRWSESRCRRTSIPALRRSGRSIFR